MNTLIPLLYEAKASDYGLIVQTEDPERLRQRMYALRREHPDLTCISFVISPLNPGSELWLVKNGEDDGE